MSFFECVQLNRLDVRVNSMVWVRSWRNFNEIFHKEDRSNALVHLLSFVELNGMNVGRGRWDFCIWLNYNFCCVFIYHIFSWPNKTDKAA